MKWIRILLPVILIMGLLLGVSSVAYAGEPNDDPGTGEGQGSDDDGGLNVDITVVGDDADVDIAVIGDNSDVTVNTTGTDVWVNGRNLNEPTVIHQGNNGASKGWIRKRINEAVGSLYTWAGETGQVLSMTMDGLAKVILTVEDQDSRLGDTSADIEELYAGLESQMTRLSDHEDRLASLDAQVEALEAQDAITQAYVKDYANYLQVEYDRKLTIMSGVFLLAVVGLAVGFGVSIHRLRSRNKRKD